MIETPVKKLYDSVLQLSGPQKKAIEKQDEDHGQHLMPIHKSEQINKHTSLTVVSRPRYTIFILIAHYCSFLETARQR